MPGKVISSSLTAYSLPDLLHFISPRTRICMSSLYISKMINEMLNATD